MQQHHVQQCTTPKPFVSRSSKAKKARKENKRKRKTHQPMQKGPHAKNKNIIT
jgi:hypothetical protein